MEKRQLTKNQEVTSTDAFASMLKMIPFQDYDEIPVVRPGEPGVVTLSMKKKPRKQKDPKESGG